MFAVKMALFLCIQYKIMRIRQITSMQIYNLIAKNGSSRSNAVIYKDIYRNGNVT